ncbi:transposase [Rickettsia endosymbiont of Oedothorax gibbosus]|uniref:transposase n=1 Tax=Rickettsia endosymbiont of Oedothorax gibbosus TaxID=931099 RepID=UPI00397CA342
MFADRTSCHKWWANQLRLILSSLAYTLVEYIRDHSTPQLLLKLKSNHNVFS